MNKFNLVLASGLLILSTIGCSMMKDAKAADPVIEKFHAQFNEKQFSEIYQDAGDQMKGAAKEQELVDLLEAVYRKLGTYQKSTQVSWHVNSGPMTSMVTVVCDTEFSDGKGTEQFLISVSADSAKLEGYNINSNDLIKK